MQPNAIRSVRFFKASASLPGALADSTHQLHTIGFIVTRLMLASGLVGESYLLAFHYSPHGLLGALRDVAGLALGRDANDTPAFHAAWERESEYFGHAGLQRWALGAIDIAMWDARARVVDQPVCRLLGKKRDRIPAYGSGGWLSYTLEELLAEARGYVRRGFTAVKIKVGSREPERDVERLFKVREAIGPQVDLMMDANQGLNLDSARALAAAVRPLRVAWFEEPLPHTDFDGYAQLGTAGIPLAMGEREYDLVALQELARRSAIDLWQPDILRLGGVAPWLESAALAGRHGIPVLPHYYKEYDVPLLTTIDNAHGAESFDWVDPLITHPIRIEGGFAYPNDGPGWGFRFKDECLTEITLEDRS